MCEVREQWQLQASPEEVTIGIPENLQELIVRQIERLPKEDQRVLEVASVAGVLFSALAVAAGVGEGIEQVEAWCEGLVRRRQFIRAIEVETWPDGTVTSRYEFLHSLYKDVLYNRLGPIRRIRLHQRIGEGEELAHGENTREIATELAVHFERGQDYRRAVQYLERAAENAMRRSAHREAIAHFEQGLKLLKNFPETSERVTQELKLQLALGDVLSFTQGYAEPDVEKTYARARELCQQVQVEEASQLFPALIGLWRFYIARAELQTAHTLAEQLLRIAEQSQNP